MMDSLKVFAIQNRKFEGQVKERVLLFVFNLFIQTKPRQIKDTLKTKVYLHQGRSEALLSVSSGSK